MIQDEAERWAREFQIDPTQIVREEWELKILKILFDSLLARKIYFKGGTALRLAYGSPRFSEDLDFTAIAAISEKEFRDFAQKVAQSSLQVKISDFKVKFYTYLIEFKISEPYLPKNFSIKIEISKRKDKQIRHSLRLINTPVTNLQVLADVEELDDIYKEKLTAYSSRKKARDLFDIWYISQKKRQVMPQRLAKIKKGEIRQELNKFLPLALRRVEKELEGKYGI